MAALAGEVGPEAFFRSLDELRHATANRVEERGGKRDLARLLALKLTNVMAALRHHDRGDVSIVSGPVQLMLEPSNGCQLRCPGCVHSANRSWRAHFDWPAGNLAPADAWSVLQSSGPAALSASLFNYGEPLLNRHFPRIALMAKSFGLHVSTSTNLALPINAGAIVRSGVDRLVMSIDGASQETYQAFRRKGNLSLVVDNIKALVAARESAKRSTPYLVWQFLTFEHNVSQVEQAMSMADALGVDEFHVVTPFSVAMDDPEIEPIRSTFEGRHVLRQAQQPLDHSWQPLLDSRSIEAAWRRGWVQRWRQNADSGRVQNGCPWLYYNLTVDAVGRVMPCCVAPKSDPNFGYLVFGHLDREDGFSTNNQSFQAARKSVGTGPTAPGSPFCAGCTERPTLTGTTDYANLLRRLDRFDALPEEIFDHALVQTS